MRQSATKEEADTGSGDGLSEKNEGKGGLENTSHISDPNG